MILFRILFVFTLYTQILIAQEPTIKDVFSQNVFKEDFNEKNNYFSTESSSDNFFGIVDGHYFLNRSTNTPYSIMSNWTNDLENFEIQTSIKMSPDKTTSTQSIGLILKYSPDNQEGLIFEINDNKKYRIRYTKEGKNKYLTSGNDGWVKSSHLNRNDVKNDLVIKTKNNKYEFFINNNLEIKINLSNRFKDGLIYGNFGIYLSPFTKAKIEYIYISAPQSYNGINKSLQLSKKEIKTLIEENEILKNKIKKNENRKLAELTNVINILETQLKETNVITFTVIKHQL